MANETVLATLTKMLTKYAAERAEILGKSQDCRFMLGNRMAAHEVLRDATRAWEEAQRDLAVAEQNEKTIDECIRETNTEIERLNRQQG